MNISRMVTASHLLWQTSVLIWALSSPLAALLHCAGWAAVFKKSRPMGGGDGGMAAEAFWQPLLNQSSSEALLCPWVTLVWYCSLAARKLADFSSLLWSFECSLWIVATVWVHYSCLIELGVCWCSHSGGEFSVLWFEHWSFPQYKPSWKIPVASEELLQILCTRRANV